MPCLKKKPDSYLEYEFNGKNKPKRCLIRKHCLSLRLYQYSKYGRERKNKLL